MQEKWQILSSAERFLILMKYGGCEVHLAGENYAGTTDAVGIFDGQPAIIDFKQTNKPKREEWIEDYYLQLTALRHGA